MSNKNLTQYQRAKSPTPELLRTLSNEVALGRGLTASDAETIAAVLRDVAKLKESNPELLIIANCGQVKP